MIGYNAMIAVIYIFLGHLFFLLWLKKQWNAAASVEWRHFQEKPKKTKSSSFSKTITSAWTVFYHEENLGNFHIFPLPMNSISDRKDSPRKSARWQRPGWDTLAVETVRQWAGADTSFCRGFMSPDYETLNALKFGALNNALWNGIKFGWNGQNSAEILASLEFRPSFGRFNQTLFHSIGHYSGSEL